MKRIFAIFLALSLLCTLVGCGKEEAVEASSAPVVTATPQPMAEAVERLDGFKALRRFSTSVNDRKDKLGFSSDAAGLTAVPWLHRQIPNMSAWNERFLKEIHIITPDNAGEKTAKGGQWVKGPGMALVGTLRDWFYDTPIIAEDLGITTPAVQELLEASGFPGMKVLEFAFSPEKPSPYLPHSYDRNCVCADSLFTIFC